VGVAIARRKALYEEIHPETKASAFKGNRHTGSLANPESGSAAPAFVDATANRGALCVRWDGGQ
jgi:hypothetical protein